MAMTLAEFKLVITCALREELPVEYFRAQGVPVLSLKAALASDLRSLNMVHKGMLVLITGPGRDNSLRAVRWIKENLRPLFVLNIGGVGLLNRALPTGRWYSPECVISEGSGEVGLDPRLPVPSPSEGPIRLRRLYSSLRPLKGQGSPVADLVDMEAYWQAEQLQNSGITFHCLKFGTDTGGPDAELMYKRSLPALRQAIKKLFSFLEQPPVSFTVVIPTRDRADRVREALESVLVQSYPPEQVIVVDDGSRDHTHEVMRQFTRVRTIALKDNYGVSRARMVGVLLARTPWVAFLDSDDRWKKDKLLHQAEFIHKYPFFEILQSEEIWIRHGRRVNPCKHHRKPEGWAWPQVLQRCLISPSGVALKRALVLNYGGFREDFPVCEDYDLWLRITRHHPVGLVPEYDVIKYGGHEDQLSKAYPAMDRFRLRSLLEAYLKERHPVFRKYLRDAITTKAKILLKGAMKRGLADDVKYYRTVLRFIEGRPSG